VEAERAVCAIPYTVLRNLALDGLSREKMRVIRELFSISIARVFAEVGRRVWIERGESGEADTDLPSGGIHDETKLQAGRAGVLGAFLTGDRARECVARSEAERTRVFVEDAERAHPGAKAALRATVTKCWDEDPYARGAFASYRPGQLLDLGPAVARPEGRLHFAGDHTSARPGWMHGAVVSAKRVVREIERGGA
jgi:monoamine oxidase